MLSFYTLYSNNAKLLSTLSRVGSQLFWNKATVRMGQSTSCKELPPDMDKGSHGGDGLRDKASEVSFKF